MTDNHLDESQDYWNKRAEGYSETVDGEIESGAYRRWLDLIEMNLDGKKNLEVLDVGCGPGFFPVILGREGHHVTAVDYSPGMLEQAKANCRKYGVNARFQQMDAQNISFPDGTFDLVISRNLVWNLDDPEKAFSEWFRVLKEGGKMMLFDGNHYLYLHDEDYAKDHPDYQVQHKDLKSVDVSVMERIAEELPLSSQRRPQWDVNRFVEMGAKSINVVTDGKDSLKIVKDGRTVYLPFKFFVCGEK